MHADRVGVQARSAARQVEHPPLRTPSDGGRIEQQQVGGGPDAQHPSVAQAVDGRRLAGQAVHSARQAHRTELARPVAHQVQAERSIIEEGQVSACVRQADQAVGMVEHPGHGLFVRIQQGRGEHGIEVLGQRQIEHHIERIAAGLRGQVGQGALLKVCMARIAHLDHLHLTPFPVEQTEGRGGRQFGPDRIAKLGPCQHRLEGLALQAQSGLPGLQALDRIRRVQGEIHGQGAARDRAMQGSAPGIGLGDGLQVGKHRVGVGSVVQQRGNHHRTTRGGGQLLEKIDPGVAALGQHEHTAAGFAQGLDQHPQLTVIGQPGRHRHTRLAVMRRRGAGRKTDGAGLHRLDQDRSHAGDFVIGGDTLGGGLAHHPGPDRRVTGECRQVDRCTAALELTQVFRDGLEIPLDALAQHVQ